MKGTGLLLIVGGWVVVVGGVVALDATTLRALLALVGLGATFAGIGLLNGGHLENAIWKRGRLS
jgi:hypothetical protein